MNTLQDLLDPIGVRLVATTLLHFLWQATLLGLLLAPCLALLERRGAARRYAICVAALGLLLALPVATFLVLLGQRTELLPLISTAGVAPALPGTALGGLLNRVDALLPWIVVVWASGAGSFGLRGLLCWVRTHHLAHHGTLAPPPALAAAAQALRRQLAILRPVKLVLSERVDVPAVVGWLAPVVLMPLGAVDLLTPSQLRAIVAHELAHVARHDHLVNLAQVLAESLFFFHPVTWWLSSRLRIEREHCCDDVAVRTCGDALGYARALSTLDELASRPRAAGAPLASLALSSQGGSLMSRITRLLGATPPRHRRPRGRLASGLLPAMFIGLLSSAGLALPAGGEDCTAAYCQNGSLVCQLVGQDGQIVECELQPCEVALACEGEQDAGAACVLVCPDGEACEQECDLPDCALGDTVGQSCAVGQSLGSNLVAFTPPSGEDVSFSFKLSPRIHSDGTLQFVVVGTNEDRQNVFFLGEHGDVFPVEDDEEAPHCDVDAPRCEAGSRSGAGHGLSFSSTSNGHAFVVEKDEDCPLCDKGGDCQAGEGSDGAWLSQVLFPSDEGGQEVQVFFSPDDDGNVFFTTSGDPNVEWVESEDSDEYPDEPEEVLVEVIEQAIQQAQGRSYAVHVAPREQVIYELRVEDSAPRVHGHHASGDEGERRVKIFRSGDGEEIQVLIVDEDEQAGPTHQIHVAPQVHSSHHGEHKARRAAHQVKVLRHGLHFQHRTDDSAPEPNQERDDQARKQDVKELVERLLEQLGLSGASASVPSSVTPTDMPSAPSFPAAPAQPGSSGVPAVQTVRPPVVVEAVEV